MASLPLLEAHEKLGLPLKVLVLAFWNMAWLAGLGPFSPPVLELITSCPELLGNRLACAPLPASARPTTSRHKQLGPPETPNNLASCR